MNRRRIEDTAPATPVQNYPSATDVPYAVLSRAAYVQYEKGNTADTQQLLDTYNVGYHVVEDLTSPEYVTAINPDNQKIIVAFRGTDSTLLNIYDDIADIEIGLGLAETPIPSYIPSRFSTGEYAYKQAKERFPDYDLTLTGHSLGGSTAEYIGDKYHEKSVVFNAGATPIEPILNTVFRLKPSSSKFYFTDTLDLISNTSMLTENNINIVTTKPEYRKYMLGSHKIENYLPPIPEKITPINKPEPVVSVNKNPMRKVYTGAVGAPMPPRIISNIHTSPMSVDKNNMPHINAVAVKTESSIITQQREKQKAIKAQFAIPNLGNTITNNDGFDFPSNLPFKKKGRTKRNIEVVS